LVTEHELLEYRISGVCGLRRREQLAFAEDDVREYPLSNIEVN